MSNLQPYQKVVEKPDPAMKVHPWVALLVALGWPMVGFLFCLIFEMLFDIKIPRLISSVINFAVACFGLFYLFPKLYHAPFGQIPLQEYLQRLGIFLPPKAWQHVLLGILLAGCTLSGMLAASILTGRYALDWSEINLTQIVFSLNPGIFEEVFYRGIIMMLLLRMTKSLQKAAFWQIVIFGVAHIKGFDLETLVDVISVMFLAVAFTFSAYKTRTLLAGMVFHFLHDALLFFVQVPGGEYQGLQENVLFYSLLWLDRKSVV